MSSPYRHHLPAGHRELEYRFERVLGAGGFGVTYLAYDTGIERPVAIKEFLPAEYAARGPDLAVGPKSEAERQVFEWARRRFVDEARLLARFDHPNIVQVQRYFEANGTAYMVMSYVEGQSLFDVIEHSGTLGERALRDILYPLLDGLQVIHAAEFLHRDIKPENIYIRIDGTPVLLDFGAARQAVAGRSRQMTRIVTPGYAPPEQYEAAGTQGPWSDIYALAGVLYSGVSGRIPADAPARVNAAVAGRPDPLAPAVSFGGKRCSKAFLRAIDHGLALRAEERPRDVDSWRTEFTTGRVDWRPPAAANGYLSDQPNDAARGARPMSRVAFAGAATLALLIWMALPLGTRAFPLPLGEFPAGPALYGLAAGLLMAFSLKFLVHGLSPIALPVAAVGWGLGLFAQTVLLLFAPGLAAILGWQVTEVYFAASAVAGVAGGTGLATAARLAGPPIAWWAGSLSVGVWGVLWWLEPYLFFNVRVELAGRVEPIGFAIIDAVLLGLAGLIGFLALLALWQPRRWPRWRRADRARDD